MTNPEQKIEEKLLEDLYKAFTDAQDFKLTPLGGLKKCQDLILAYKTSLLQSLLERGPEDKVCEYCQKPFDREARGYDGYANCGYCEEGKYSYESDWGDIGKNEANQEWRNLINLMINECK